MVTAIRGCETVSQHLGQVFSWCLESEVRVLVQLVPWSHAATPSSSPGGMGVVNRSNAPLLTGYCVCVSLLLIPLVLGCIFALPFVMAWLEPDSHRAASRPSTWRPEPRPRKDVGR